MEPNQNPFMSTPLPPPPMPPMNSGAPVRVVPPPPMQATTLPGIIPPSQTAVNSVNDLFANASQDTLMANTNELNVNDPMVTPTTTPIPNSAKLPNNPVFVNGMLKKPVTEKPPIVEKKVEKSLKKEKLPLSMILIIHFVALTLIGVGVFMLWQYQSEQITSLKQSVSDKNNQLQKIQSELIKVQDGMNLSSQQPVFVAQNGTYSFYQEIPGLAVNSRDGVVTLSYGEVNGETPINGLVMKITEEKTNGLGLSKIVDDLFAQKNGQVENLDKRSEMIADNIGFSFVQMKNGQENIVYFLQKNVQSPTYIKIEYNIEGATDADYANFEKITFGVISSLKLY